MKKAVLKITLISIIAALAIVFSFISFKVPGNKEYVGFARAIYNSLDYGGGIYTEYDAVKPNDMSEEDYQNKLTETYDRVQSILNQQGIDSALAYKLGHGIRIEAPEKDDTSSILTTIGAGELIIRTSSSADSDPIVTGSDVTSVFATQLQTSETAYQWGAYISFTDEGKEALSTATKNAESSAVTLYMFRGDAESSFFSLQTSEKISDGFMFISSTSMTESYATSLALEMYCGSMPLTVETIGEVNTISASVGREALLGLTIAFAALMLCLIVVFVVRYRELGLMIIVALAFFVGILLFILQAIPVFELSIAGMASIMLSILLFAACILIILEKIRNEYAFGKKIPAAVKAGFIKSNGLVIDISVLALIVAALTYFIGTGSLKVFALGLVIGSILSAVTAIVITRLLADGYAAFNKTNEKRVNFKREEGIDEIG